MQKQRPGKVEKNYSKAAAAVEHCWIAALSLPLSLHLSLHLHLSLSLSSLPLALPFFHPSVPCPGVLRWIHHQLLFRH